MEVRNVVSWWYLHIFKIFEWAHRSCSRSLEATKWWWANTEVEKCKFFTNLIHYLGHVIKLGHLKASSHPIDAISCWQAPSNFTQLRSFLSLRNTFLRLLQSFWCTAAHIGDKLQKYQPHVYTNIFHEGLDALHALQEKLTSLPVFAVPRSQEICTVKTCAFERQAEC